MLDANELVYYLLTELNTPAEAFNMVMEYARQSEKNPWKCFSETFNSSYYMVVIRDKEGSYVGYGSGYIQDDRTTFFLVHGYLRNGCKNKPSIIDHIAQTVSKHSGALIEKVKLTSDWNPRLWHMWGFKEDKMVAYEKEID